MMSRIWMVVLGCYQFLVFLLLPCQNENVLIRRMYMTVHDTLAIDRRGLTLRVKNLELGSTDVNTAGTELTSTAAEINTLHGITADVNELNILDGVLATAAEINQAADVSTKIVNATASTLTVTEALHNGKTIVLDRAAGIAVTLPSAASVGQRYRFIVKTTFTSAATIKSVVGSDVMAGWALMSNDSDNNVVLWPCLAATGNDTIDLLGTGNSTGGMANQVITIESLAAGLWYVTIIGDAAGTEATPFANTVA